MVATAEKKVFIQGNGSEETAGFGKSIMMNIKFNKWCSWPPTHPKFIYQESNIEHQYIHRIDNY